LEGSDCRSETGVSKAMSSLATNAITDASGGNTATINGYTPTVSNMAGRNRIINGDMRIDQRNAGASVNAGSAYTLDRWNVDRVWAGSTVAIQQSTTAPAGFSNSLSATVSTGSAVASGSYFSIQQFIEGYNIADMAWGTASASQFTVSFWVRSSVTGTFGVGFRNSAFDLSYWTTYTVNVANTWEKKSVTILAPTSGTWGTGNSYGINLIFSLGCGSTYKAVSNDSWNAGSKLGAIGETDLIATTGATFYITGVQLEAGSVATPFEHRQYGQELALCQRYYEIFKNSSGSTQNLYLGYQIGSGNAWVNAPFVYQVTKRATPTISISNLGGGNFTFSAANASVNYVSLQFTSASAGTSQVYVVDGNTWLTVSSEL
jgi:hypothetical protein